MRPPIELSAGYAALWDLARGAEYIFADRRGQSANGRMHFERIIKRAGLVPWPRLFQNLRASRKSELMRDYELKTVCKWIGNTPAVAAKHYAMSTDISADFQRAVGLDKGAVKSAERPLEKAQRLAQTTARRHNGQELTNVENQSEITGDNALADVSSHLLTTTEQMPNWAVQDSNL